MWGIVLHKVMARENPRLKGGEEVHPLYWDEVEGCLCVQNWQYTVPGVRRVCMALLRSHRKGTAVHCSIFMTIARDRLLYFKKSSNIIVLEARGSNSMCGVSLGFPWLHYIIAGMCVCTRARACMCTCTFNPALQVLQCTNRQTILLTYRPALHVYVHICKHYI